NLHVHESHKLIPAYGICAVEVDIYASVPQILTGEYIENPIVKKAIGMCYIGTRPTVDGMNRKIEVNLLDFDADLYSSTVRIRFKKFIRGDERFDTLEQLQEQIK